MEISYNKGRVSSFCDAVFSIAMTLLILEIDVPSGNVLEEYGLGIVLENRIPNFIGLFVSFMVIALYWVSHLRIFEFIKKVDGRILWLNIFLLLFVVMLPFSTAMYVGAFFSTSAFVFYCLNLVFLGLFNYLLIRLVTKRGLIQNTLSIHWAKWLRFRSLNALVVWMLAALLAYPFPTLARTIFVLIFIVQMMGDRHFKKRISKEAASLST